MKKITISLVYFRSLTLANLEAALYSVRHQDLSSVESVQVLDNNTDDSMDNILNVIHSLNFPVPIQLHSSKHGDPKKTHSWSTNIAVRLADTSWVLLTRADYLLDFSLVERFVQIMREHDPDWNGFITSNMRNLGRNVEFCEGLDWQRRGLQVLREVPGADVDHSHIDTGVWMARRDAFESIGGLDESLVAWGHVQTLFQYQLYQSGVEFVKIPEVLFYHPQHSAERDMTVAHQQLQAHGIDIRELWSRYEGQKPY